MRITDNFKPILSGDNEVESKAFLTRCRQEGVPYKYDKRNGIWCLNPTEDIVMYRNYIEYLNSCYSDWVNYGYLDAGLVPLLMGPSFVADNLNSQVMEIAKVWRVPLHPMKAVSFLNKGYVGGTKDIWVKKEDLARVLGVSEEKATLSYLLNEIVRKM